MATFFALHTRFAWVCVITTSLMAGLAVGWADASGRAQQRLPLLQTEAHRSSIEIMSTTLNGNLMGSITLLGLIDRDIKQEASNGLMSEDAHVLGTLSAVGGTFEADGTFIVGEDGFVKTSWDRTGKSSTGTDVRFRPYYQMALRGQSNVYAAVSMARGDRALYFTAPVYAEHAKSTVGIGAVVARTNLAQVDALLRDRFDAALLLSPQGIVFASSRPEWIGQIDGVPDAGRLASIRRLKQFGKMFEEQVPQTLPLTASDGVQSVGGRRFAVATAEVNWNDPSGTWHLVLLEDLDRAAPWQDSLPRTGVASALALILGWLWLRLLAGRYAQTVANEKLSVYAQQQEATVHYRALLAQLALQLQRCSSLQELAQVFLREARTLLHAPQGVLYVCPPDASDHLQLAAAAGCATPPQAMLALGEGLLGQCASERQTRIVPTPPDGYWIVRSGLGDAQPQALLLVPLLLHDELIGALELAVLHVPDTTLMARLEDAAALLANSLEILRRNLQLQALAVHKNDATGGTV